MNIQINELKILEFGFLLVRLGIVLALMPFLGDRFIPSQVKILFSLFLSFILYPVLSAQGVFSSLSTMSTGQLMSSFVIELILALLLGFTSRIAMDAIEYGGNLIGQFMGFANASVFDPHQESQSQILAQFQSAIAMLIFLSIEGHHLMVKALLDSYYVVGIGQAGFSKMVSEQLIQITRELIHFGIRMSAPMGVVIFGLNIAFGVFSRAMPQVNILILSMAASALVGFFVIVMSIGSFENISTDLFLKISEWMLRVLKGAQQDFSG